MAVDFISNRREEYLSAEAARNITKEAQSMNGAYMREETERALQLVASAAQLGKRSLDYSCTSEVVVARLSGLGYAVKVINDQRDGDYMIITW